MECENNRIDAWMGGRDVQMEWIEEQESSEPSISLNVPITQVISNMYASMKFMWELQIIVVVNN